jgi:hypothetical protein
MPSLKEIPFNKSDYICKLIYHPKYKDWYFSSSQEIAREIKKTFNIDITSSTIRNFLSEHLPKDIICHKVPPTVTFWGLKRNIKKLKEDLNARNNQK